MGWRRGESCLGHLFVFVLLFIFSHGWAYYASAGVSLGGLPPSEVGWAPSEVICPPSEVFVVRFWTGAYIIPGVLDSVTRLWLRVAVRIALSCVGLVDVRDWGGVS